MNKVNVIVAAVAAVLLLGAGVCSGWFLHKELRPCPTITSDTIEIVDPYWHRIADSLINLPPVERIKWLPRDTLFVPTYLPPVEVDTPEVVKDFYSVFEYEWDSNDSIVDINLVTTVTQNMPVEYELNYKLKKPFTTINNVIDNSTTYSKYIQFGLSMPVYTYKPEATLNLQDLSLEGTYVFPKGYVGVGWQPNNSLINVRAGVTLFKFKRIN